MPAHAGAKAFLWYVDQHIVVDEGTVAASDPRRWVRPVPVSMTSSTDRGTLGNISVELPVEAKCGHAEAGRTVLCLNTSFELGQADQLALLAFADGPFVLHAGSESAAYAARRVLGARPERVGNAEIRVGIEPTCSGACERRITLESK